MYKVGMLKLDTYKIYRHLQLLIQNIKLYVNTYNFFQLARRIKIKIKCKFPFNKIIFRES